MNKKVAIDWLFMRLQEYDAYNDLGDMTFLDDIKKDKEYALKHFPITDSVKLRRNK